MANIVLSGGGTAGHINPALALAEVLQARGHDVYFAGTPGGVEARLVPQAGIDFMPFEASGFRRGHPLSIASGVRKISKSTKLAKKWFDEVKPDVVVGFGGYVSIPVARAAEGMGIPVVIHEQNSVMGMANKYLSARANAVCVTYACSGEHVKDKSLVHVTGNPVRGRIMQATREEGRNALGVPQDALMLLVFGGSNGARHINEATVALKDELLSRENLYVVHITGPKELDSVQAALSLSSEEARRYIVMGYQDNMPETLAAADCVVSRAGATSLAEISARAVPALLIPFPFAAENHQSKNAEEYVAAGAAYLLEDDKLDTPAFAEKLFELVDSPKVREGMQSAAATFNTGSAAESLADIVLSCVR